jgi:hypothetical protein
MKMAGKNEENSMMKPEEEIGCLLFYLQTSPDDADCQRLLKQKLRRFYSRQQRRDKPS